tara:strand:+ start:10578 stop:11336 length:759 start_codon:yes stop_codon:yes gene_type:complete
MNDLSKYMNKDALHYDVRGAISKSKWSDYKGKKNIENDGNALLNNKWRLNSLDPITGNVDKTYYFPSLKILANNLKALNYDTWRNIALGRSKTYSKFFSLDKIEEEDMSELKVIKQQEKSKLKKEELEKKLLIKELKKSENEEKKVIKQQEKKDNYINKQKSFGQLETEELIKDIVSYIDNKYKTNNLSKTYKEKVLNKYHEFEDWRKVVRFFLKKKYIKDEIIKSDNWIEGLLPDPKTIDLKDIADVTFSF